MKTAIAYYRVSADQQGKSGLGMEGVLLGSGPPGGPERITLMIF